MAVQGRTLGPGGLRERVGRGTPTFAHEILRHGGTYRLVLGKGLEAQPIEDREAKLREKAAELGFDVSGDRFTIIDGNQLARWIERYPALAVSTVIRGTGHVAIDFESWTRKAKHRFKWVQSAERDELKAKSSSSLPSRRDLISGSRAKAALVRAGVRWRLCGAPSTSRSWCTSVMAVRFRHPS